MKQNIEEGDLVEFNVKPEFRSFFSAHILNNEVSRVIWADESHIWAVPEKPVRGSVNRVPVNMVEITILSKPGPKMKREVDDLDALIVKLSLKVQALVDKALTAGSGVDGPAVRSLVKSELEGFREKMEDFETRLLKLEREWFG